MQRESAQGRATGGERLVSRLAIASSRCRRNKESPCSCREFREFDRSLASEENLDLGCFAANNIVAFDDRRDANRLRRVLFLLVHANHSAVRANENFCSAS